MVFVLMIITFLQPGKSVLTIEINVDKPEGSLYLAIYDNVEDFMEDPVQHGIEPIHGDKVELSFELPTGHYAISVFRDTNGNGELDTNFFGIPTEPYGFSNNARGKFGPPSFEQCLIQFKDSKKIAIDL